MIKTVCLYGEDLHKVIIVAQRQVFHHNLIFSGFRYFVIYLIISVFTLADPSYSLYC